MTPASSDEPAAGASRVGVGRPGVEREDRRLHGEGGVKARKSSTPAVAREVRVGERAHVEGRHAGLALRG